MLLQLRLTFFHQLLSYLLRLLHADRKVAYVLEYTIFQLLRQLLEHAVLVDLLGPPVALLWWNDCCGRDLDAWVNKEQCQQFAVPRLACVLQLERHDAVLEHVRENEQPALTGQDFAEDL